ncbi:hypothetical protein B0H10DRAFT_2234060 [Mycena sp. CBHHK59/15]|nr:hypothetical protein B0H10DRAFT_2234060 [Mycena sp. CBHHK59/15]
MATGIICGLCSAARSSMPFVTKYLPGQSNRGALAARAQMDGAPPRAQSARPRSVSTRRVCRQAACKLKLATRNARISPTRRLACSGPARTWSSGSLSLSHERGGRALIRNPDHCRAHSGRRARHLPLALPYPTGCPTRTLPLPHTADVRSSGSRLRARAMYGA